MGFSILESFGKDLVLNLDYLLVFKTSILLVFCLKKCARNNADNVLVSPTSTFNLLVKIL